MHLRLATRPLNSTTRDLVARALKRTLILALRNTSRAFIVITLLLIAVNRVRLSVPLSQCCCAFHWYFHIARSVLLLVLGGRHIRSR